MKAELVFVPFPAIGHLISTVQAAKLLLDIDDRLSITILTIRGPHDTKLTQFIDSISLSDRLELLNLPCPESASMNFNFMEIYKPHIRDAVSDLVSRDNSSLAGIVLDMFCTTVIDVAKEFDLPSYVFFTSGVASLGLVLQLEAILHQLGGDPSQFESSDVELEFPSFVNPLPCRVLPNAVLDRDRLPFFQAMSRRLGEAQGIIVNSFLEFEAHALNSFSDGKILAPPVYTVGPLLNIKSDADVGSDEGKEIMDWLDDQPPESVVFLCFGSGGCFREDQAKEIAIALEKSGHRFLWSLRKPSPPGQSTGPSDYQNLEEILPVGFLDRTAGVGKIIGWAPQVAVLAHPAIGGFVSHCGWNSILESIWYGVPIATWPMYAEQQFNAFQMVKELGLAAEITLTYTINGEVVVTAADIETGIRHVMEPDNEIRAKVKEMSKTSRQVLMDGGSSFSSMNRLIEAVITKVPYNK